jgi:hypothetical protein
MVFMEIEWWSIHEMEWPNGGILSDGSEQPSPLPIDQTTQRAKDRLREMRILHEALWVRTFDRSNLRRVMRGLSDGEAKVNANETKDLTGPAFLGRKVMRSYDPHQDFNQSGNRMTPEQVMLKLIARRVTALRRFLRVLYPPMTRWRMRRGLLLESSVISEMTFTRLDRFYLPFEAWEPPRPQRPAKSEESKDSPRPQRPQRPPRSEESKESPKVEESSRPNPKP